MLRQGLLEGVSIAVAGDDACVAEASALGARVHALVPAGDDTTVDPVPDVVVCATPQVDDAFAATRAVANAWIAEERTGKVILVASAGDAPQSAALESLARTLSVEWARHGITAVAIVPRSKGPGPLERDVAQLVAFLASPAGDYYSGCVFSLGETSVSPAA